MSTSTVFSTDFIADVLSEIYAKGKGQSATDLSRKLFQAVLQSFNEATDKGVQASAAPDPDDDFRQALQHSNEVFSAFKVHRMQADMVKALVDSNGDLRVVL